MTGYFASHDDPNRGPSNNGNPLGRSPANGATEIHELLSRATVPDAVDDIIALALRNLGQEARFDLAVVYELNGDCLRVRATAGPLSDAPIRHHTLNLARFAAFRRALEQRGPTVLAGTSNRTDGDGHVDPFADEAGHPDPFGGMLDLPANRTRVLLPLVASSQTVGLVSLDRRSPEPFTEPELRVVNAYGQAMAISLLLAEQTRLVARLRQQLNQGTPSGGADAGGPNPAASPRAQFPSFRDQEHDFLLCALKQTRGKIHGKDGAAALLDLRPTTLQSKLKRHGISAAALRKR